MIAPKGDRGKRGNPQRDATSRHFRSGSSRRREGPCQKFIIPPFFSPPPAALNWQKSIIASNGPA
jgi:hypothetical protein